MFLQHPRVHGERTEQEAGEVYWPAVLDQHHEVQGRLKKIETDRLFYSVIGELSAWVYREALGGRIGSVHSEGAYHSFTFFFIVSVSPLYRVAVVSIVVRIPYCLVEKNAFELSES